MKKRISDLKKRFVIGIVGGIACGKSTVSNYLKEKGAKIIDADKIAHKIIEQPNILLLLKERWEKDFPEMFNLSGKDFRKAVAKIVFNDYQELKFLEDTLYKPIEGEVGTLLCRDNLHNIIVLDVPLLFEAGLDRFCDQVWFIYMKEKDRFKNFCKRYPDDIKDVGIDFTRREERQVSWEIKRGLANFILRNRINHWDKTQEQIDKQ